MHSTLIDAETIMRAMADAVSSGALHVDERLAAAGIDPAAAEREATAQAEQLVGSIGLGRATVRLAFIAGLELGARAARLVP